MPAANSDTRSAARIVRYARANPRSTDDRTVLPDLISSLSRSKYTMYESAVTPTDTMMPVAPARLRARPLDWLRVEMIEYSNAPDTARPRATTRPRAR